MKALSEELTFKFAATIHYCHQWSRRSNNFIKIINISGKAIFNERKYLSLVAIMGPHGNGLSAQTKQTSNNHRSTASMEEASMEEAQFCDRQTAFSTEVS